MMDNEELFHSIRFKTNVTKMIQDRTLIETTQNLYDNCLIKIFHGAGKIIKL